MTKSRRWWIPVSLVALGALVVWFAPAERSLGAGIRWVYVHVGLVWAGTLALAVAGGGGLVCLVIRRATLASWISTVARVGLAVFGLGIAFSMVAARVNWGAVFLAEPRMAASLRFMALATIAQVVAGWIGRPQATALLASLTFALLLWDVGRAELVMHPSDPVRTATSAAIQWTFASTFAIATALTAWTVVTLRRSAE